MIHSRFILVIAFLASIVISEDVELASAAYGEEVAIQPPSSQDDGQDFVPDSSYPVRPTYGGNVDWADSNTLRYGPPTPQYSAMPTEQYSAAVVTTYAPVREKRPYTIQAPAKTLRPRPAPRPRQQLRRPYQQTPRSTYQPRRYSGVKNSQRDRYGRRHYGGSAPDNDYRPARHQGNHQHSKQRHPRARNQNVKAPRPRPKSPKHRRRTEHHVTPSRGAYGRKVQWNDSQPTKYRKKKPKSPTRFIIADPIVIATYTHSNVEDQQVLKDIDVQDELVSIPTPISVNFEENNDDTDLIALQNELEQPVPPITEQQDGATSLGKVNAAEASTPAPSEDATASPLEGANAGLF